MKVVAKGLICKFELGSFQIHHIISAIIIMGSQVCRCLNLMYMQLNNVFLFSLYSIELLHCVKMLGKTNVHNI